LILFNTNFAVGSLQPSVGTLQLPVRVRNFLNPRRCCILP